MRRWSLYKKKPKMKVENIASLHWKSLLTRLAFAVVALSAVAFLFACTKAEHKPAGPPEKITIAFATLPETALAQIAQSRGFYREEGLEATAHLLPYGKLALKEVLEGKADFATVAETPVMFAIMNGEKISVIATIHSSSLGHAILARKDRGILTSRDLKGKKIAATLGTTSHFYLDASLVTYGIPRKDVQVVDLKAEEIPDALARGDIDAVSTFNPYVAFTQKKLGDRGITFHDKNIYRYTFNVVATQEFIHKNPAKVRKMLLALVKAEEFARSNQSEAQKIVADFSGIEIGIVRDIWADASIAVKLDQPLLISLEDESRWAIKGGLTGARKVPNYLDYIYFDGLKAVKPEAVRILR
jgi:ABC-type nitrate/sulfonate/bicarbonate transport system substrate-binding protein